MRFSATDLLRPRPATPTQSCPALPRPWWRAHPAWAVVACLIGTAGLAFSPARAAESPAAARPKVAASAPAQSAPRPAPRPAPKTAAKPSPKAPPKAAPKAPAKPGPATGNARPKPASAPAKPASAPAKPASAPAKPAGPPALTPPSTMPAAGAKAAAPAAWVAPGKPPAQAASAASSVGATTDLAAWCETVSAHLTGLSQRQCLGSGLQAGDGRSVQGVPLWHRDVMPQHGPARLRVLVLGGIHGDEMASVNVVFDWLERSLKASDEPIHWRMVPLVNPDGLMRKPSTRVNARGVDLNRNFPTPDWNSSAQSYWISRTGRDPRRFPGPKAMSEPETQWLQRQVDLFKPHLIVSVHAPYGVLDFDGPPPPPDKMGSLHLDQVGIYPGSLGNYGGVVRRVPVVTLELRNAAKVAPLEVSAMWSDLLDWIDRRMDNMAQLRSPDEGRGPRTR